MNKERTQSCAMAILDGCTVLEACDFLQESCSASERAAVVAAIWDEYSRGKNNSKK